MSRSTTAEPSTISAASTVVNEPSTTSTASTVVDEPMAKPKTNLHHITIQEPSYTEKEQQLLAQMRTQLTARLANGKLEPSADAKLPHSLHWRDLYAHYRHLTAVETTADPRTLGGPPPPLPRPQDWPDYELYRFLKARQFNVTQGVDMLLNALVYRQRLGAADLLSQSECPFKDLQHMMMVERLHYTDSGGRPIFLNQLGSALITQLREYYPPALPYMTELWIMDSGMRAQQESSTQLGRRITLLSVILEAKGATLAHRELLTYLEPVIWVDDNVFAESMYQLIVVNAPSVVTVLWQIAQVLLDKQTRAKFVFLSANSNDDIKRLIGDKETPAEYGGQCDRCAGHCTARLTDWEEGWKRIGRGSSEEVKQWEGEAKEDKVDIHARYDHDIKFKLDKQQPDGTLEVITVWWSFTIDAKDIDVSLVFQPATQPPPNSSTLLTPTYNLLSPTRFTATAAGSVHRGCHHFRVRWRGVDEGVCVLRFSNSMSTFSSKTVHVKAGLVRATG